MQRRFDTGAGDVARVGLRQIGIHYSGQPSRRLVEDRLAGRGRIRIAGSVHETGQHEGRPEILVASQCLLDHRVGEGLRAEVVVARVRRVKVTIAPGKPSASKTIKLKVRNVEFGSGAPANRSFAITMSGSTCPNGLVTQIDADVVMPGLQVTGAVPLGGSVQATLVVTVKLQDLTTTNAKAPFRCRFEVNAVALDTAPDVDDGANPEGNTTSIEVESVDKNDLYSAGYTIAIEGMPQACYWHPMANLQVKNVPEGLHRKIRAQAKRHGRTVRDLVLEAVRREVEREEFRVRLAKREAVDLGRPAARTLDEIREEREREAGH